MIHISDKREKRLEFGKLSAKAWQNFFDTKNILPGISLSPEQTAIVLQEEEQMLINGSAGSGKSLTLLYKLMKIMEQEREPLRILYCSYNTTLIEDARKRREQSERFQALRDTHMVKMQVFHNAMADLLRNIGFANVKFSRISVNELQQSEEKMIRRTMALLATYIATEAYQKLPNEQKLYKTHEGTFLKDEILWMKANGFITEDIYLNCERIGRGSTVRLTKEQRKTVYHLFKQYEKELTEKFHDHLDLEDYALEVLRCMDQIPDSLKYDYIFVDEVQDLQAMQLKALVQLAKKSLIVSGDPKQRIYKRSPFSYRELGLNIEGRKTKNLRVNYRSTKQIMKLANSISFEDEKNDRHENVEFVREGEIPIIHYFPTIAKESAYLIKTINEIRARDEEASIAVIHRHDSDITAKNNCLIKRSLQQNFEVVAAEQYGRRFKIEGKRKPIFYTDVFSVKGLEFDYVFVVHFDRDHYPHKKRIDELNNLAGEKQSGSHYDSDYNAIINDEKKLLYVAATRARKNLCFTYHGRTNMSISQSIRDFYLHDYKAVGFKANTYSKEA